MCSLRAEPYETRVVLPHERTHAGPKEGRLRLLRALGAQVEPIFLLYDGRLERPDGERRARRGAGGRAQPALARRGRATRSACRRAAADRRRSPSLRDDARVPRRGRERRERVAVGRDRAHGAGGSDDLPDPQDRGESRAGRRRATLRRGAAERPLRCRHLPEEWNHVRHGRAWRARHRARRPARPGRSTYTPYEEEAKAAVDAGAAEAALLVRPPSVDLVRELAERGETMPQKSTYFYPKLPSGLLFHPL